jgi:Zn-dependent protease with chaperone function
MTTSDDTLPAIDPPAAPAASNPAPPSPAADGGPPGIAEAAARAALARLTRTWGALAGVWLLVWGFAGAWAGRAAGPMAEGATALGAIGGVAVAVAWLAAGAVPMARRLARGDGSTLAAWSGARPLTAGFGPLATPGGLDGAEAGFVEVARAAAAEAGLPRPRLHVWSGEPSINLLAAGWTPPTSAVIATRGALDKLGERELRALVLHQLLLVRSGQARYHLAATSLIAAFGWVQVAGNRWRQAGLAGPGRAGRPWLHLVGSAVAGIGAIAVPWTLLVQRAAAQADAAAPDRALAETWPSWTPPFVSAMQKVWYESDVQADRPNGAPLMLLRPFLLWSPPHRAGATHPPFAARLRALTGHDLLPLAPRPGDGASIAEATAAAATDAATRPSTMRFAALAAAPSPDSSAGAARSPFIDQAMAQAAGPAPRPAALDASGFDEQTVADARRALGLPPVAPPAAAPSEPATAPSTAATEPVQRAGAASGEVTGRRRWRWRRMRSAEAQRAARAGMEPASGWPSGFAMSSSFGPATGLDDRGEDSILASIRPTMPSAVRRARPGDRRDAGPAAPPAERAMPAARPVQGRGLAPAAEALDPPAAAPLSRPLPLRTGGADPLAAPRVDDGDAAEAAGRLSRLAGRNALRAAVLGCMLTSDHAQERAAWAAEMGDGEGVVRILADVALQPRAARMPWFAEMVRRSAGGPLEDRRMVVESARRMMTAAGIVKPLDRLRWLALRHGLGAGGRRPLTAANADHSPAFYRANLQSIATYTAFLARLIPVYSADVGIDAAGERWYTAVLQRFIGVSPLPPCRVPDSDALVHALRALQALSWINRPPLVRAWVGEAVSHSGPPGLTPDAADALYLTCWMLDSPMPPELARLFPPIAGDGGWSR